MAVTATGLSFDIGGPALAFPSAPAAPMMAAPVASAALTFDVAGTALSQTGGVSFTPSTAVAGASGQTAVAGATAVQNNGGNLGGVLANVPASMFGTADPASLAENKLPTYSYMSTFAYDSVGHDLSYDAAAKNAAVVLLDNFYKEVTGGPDQFSAANIAGMKQLIASMNQTGTPAIKLVAKGMQHAIDLATANGGKASPAATAALHASELALGMITGTMPPGLQMAVSPKMFGDVLGYLQSNGIKIDATSALASSNVVAGGWKQPGVTPIDAAGVDMASIFGGKNGTPTLVTQAGDTTQSPAVNQSTRGVKQLAKAGAKSTVTDLAGMVETVPNTKVTV